MLCERCGTVFSQDRREGLLDYRRPPGVPAPLPRFAAYAQEITADWVARFRLAGEHVVEWAAGPVTSPPSCSPRASAGSPASTHLGGRVRPARRPVDRRPDVFVRDQVRQGTAALVCQHTLEHIPALAKLRSRVAREGLVLAAAAALL
ncbi:hypothetical protein HBB16_01150 [Pseudonocardia sp. MCCB 268]|nr:hypothetical protein [Pseudonocardia cytotoxica]